MLVMEKSDFRGMAALRRGLWSLLFTGLIGVVATGCHVTPYQRTLPDWIRNVYVPLAENQTAEPGLEEVVTNALIEEMLADGRLNPVRRSEADVVMKVVIRKYREMSDDFEGDDVERRRSAEIEFGLFLYEPNDMDVPIASVLPFIVSIRYVSDYRSLDVEQEPDARRRLAHQSGIEIIRSVLTKAVMATP